MLRSARTAARARYRRCPHHNRGCGFYLVESASPGRLVGPPAQQPGAVPEAAAADVIVSHLDDQFGPHRLPIAGTLRAPPAGSPWCIAGKPRRHDQPFEPLRERLAFEAVQCRGKADVIELALPVIEAEQQRPD